MFEKKGSAYMRDDISGESKMNNNRLGIKAGV